VTTVPRGWRSASIVEIAGGTPSEVVIGPFGSNLKVSDYCDLGVPLVFVKNVRTKNFTENLRYVSPEKAHQLLAHQVLPGDVLVTKMGEPPGDAAVYRSSEPGVVTADCIRIRVAGDVLPEFVSYAFETVAVRRQMEGITRGVAQRKVSLARFRESIRLPLPPLGEQRRIVEILEDHLSRLDAAESDIASSERRLKGLHKSLLLRLIPDVADYPANWQASTVEQAGKVGLGRQRHPDWHTGPNMRPYLRVANVFEDRIDNRSLYEMHWPGDTFDRFRLVPGDVLLNEGQTPELLGRPALYRGNPAEVAFTNSLLRFQASEAVLPEFALLVFRRHMHAGRFSRESRITTNIAHLSAGRLKPIEFPLPPLPVQDALVTRAEEQLSALTRVAAETSAARSRSAGLRRALLGAAFSGRLT